MKYTAQQAASDSLAAVQQHLPFDMDAIYDEIRTAANSRAFSAVIYRDMSGTEGVLSIDALTRILRADGYHVPEPQTSAGRYVITVRW